jgi:hypothetical protein
MHTLIIEDLPVIAELDRRAMSSVHGGTSTGIMLPFMNSILALTSNLAQYTQQEQNTSVVTGANVAFAQFMKSDVKPTQVANNQTVFNIGALA